MVRWSGPRRGPRRAGLRSRPPAAARRICNTRIGVDRGASTGPGFCRPRPTHELRMNMDTATLGDASAECGGAVGSVVFADVVGCVRASASRPADAPVCTIKNLYLVRF